MVTAIVIWAIVAAFLLAVILYRVFGDKKHLRRGSRRSHAQHPKFIELGKEEDEFFVTGDTPVADKSDDYDIYTDQ